MAHRTVTRVTAVTSSTIRACQRDRRRPTNRPDGTNLPSMNLRMLQTGTGNWVLGSDMISAIRMWDFSRRHPQAFVSPDKLMHRWTAKFLLLAMFFSAFGPLAFARADQPDAMHCMRKPLLPAASNQPAMHCHHAMAPSPAQETTENSFRSLDCCCQNHDCCRGLKTSEWARPGANLLSYVALLIERAPVLRLTVHLSAVATGQDSTRAPPRG
jgi:hypothetical protein